MVKPVFNNVNQQISYLYEVLRKSIHLSSLWMVVSIGIFPSVLNILLFSFLLFAICFIEYGNHKKWPLFSETYGRMFNRILREQETQEKFRFSGAPYVIAAALMVTILFSDVVAMTALSVMLVGDTAAALIGRKYGKRKINQNRKSVEGSLAFWIASFVILVFFGLLYSQPIWFYLYGILGITAAMFAEIYENRIRIDDNFSIPLVMGLFLMLA